jgi:MYXO-CTERM domain-containing protein
MTMRMSALLLVGLLAVSGVASAKSVTVAVGWDDHNTGATNLRFYPETTVVWAGEAVTWKAVSDTPHTVSEANPLATTPQDAYPASGFESSPGAQLTPAILQQWFGPGGFLLPARSFAQTFADPGTYVYICKIHPGMTGTITVLNETTSRSTTPVQLPGTSEPSSPARGGRVDVQAGWGSGDTSMDRFAPDNLTIAVNTTVVWTNTHTDEPHTVTGWLANQAPPPGTAPSTPPVFDSSPNVQGEPPGFSGPAGVLMAHGANTEFTHTFVDPGTWTYRCKLHAGMWGTVVVLEKPTGPANNTMGNSNTTRGSTQAGSTIPGFEAPLLLLGLGAIALVRRRRA